VVLSAFSSIMNRMSSPFLAHCRTARRQIDMQGFSPAVRGAAGPKTRTTYVNPGASGIGIPPVDPRRRRSTN